MKKLRIKIAKFFNPDLKIPISGSERSVIQTALALMQCEDTLLLIHPNREKFYIKSADDQLTLIVCVYPASVLVANHKFRTDVPFSKRAMNLLHSKFLEYTEDKRDALEAMVNENTELSLRKAYEIAKDIVSTHKTE
jgi:hypothetical protein